MGEEQYRISTGLCEVLHQKFILQHEGTILSLQHCKLIREQNTNDEEWMGCFRIRANEFGYKEKDRRLKEQFINGINDDDMMTGIIKKSHQ